MTRSSNLDTGVKVKHGDDMNIGDLARATGTTPRQLRFYESRGLITSSRGANNYRDFGPTAVARVRQIRDLLEAGLPTRLIEQLLPCLESPRQPIVFEGVTPETLAVLTRERDRMTERIETLTRNRDAISTYLTELAERQGRAAV
jgi:DNA-binding transcriptional MerR regulator